MTYNSFQIRVSITKGLPRAFFVGSLASFLPFVAEVQMAISTRSLLNAFWLILRSSQKHPGATGALGQQHTLRKHSCVIVPYSNKLVWVGKLGSPLWLPLGL